MRIELGNVDARVLAASDEELAWLREYLVFDDPEARFTNGERFVSLFDEVASAFPAGLVGKIRAAAKRRVLDGGAPAPFVVETVDPRPVPALPSQRAGWLRDYQQRAFDACLVRGRGIVKIPTGGGKTEVMAALSLLPLRWLIIVPQADLLHQTADRLEKRTGVRPGICGDGEWNPQRVTVATFQTLHKRMTKAKSPEEARAARELVCGAEGLMVDECHTLPAGSLYHVARAARAAYYRVGFSGTPLARADKRSMFVVAQLGSIIAEVTSQELVAAGVLSQAEAHLVPCEQSSRAPTWQGVYGECVVRSKVRNAVVVDMALRAAKPSLVFVSQVGHGKKLTPMLEKAGLRVELVWGKADTGARRAALERLRRGDLDCIVCSAVFQQGIDLPELESVVMASGGASTIATLQRRGRGTRTTETKSRFQLWDVLDRGHRWLVRHAEERLAAYTGEGDLVTVHEELAAGAPARDERGLVQGSREQAKANAQEREAANLDLIGVKALRNPSRGRNPLAPDDGDYDW